MKKIKQTMFLNDQIILASSNPGKLSEFKSLLPNLTFISQTELQIPEAEETGLSFIENAILKARHASNLSNLPALADDSGLAVAALKGAPGIYSARFTGPKASSEANNALLLEKLADVSEAQRGAYFYCAIALVQHAQDPIPVIATGHLQGAITVETKGTNGFGYDPLFYLKENQCTLAELTPEAKNKISHRAKALQALKAQLETIYE